jgi:hypothetical protein
MIVAECGTGKTLMGMLTIHQHAQRWVRNGNCNGNYRAIVLCPDNRGLRIPVATVVSMVADATPTAEILAGYPDLEALDVREALRFAAESVRERELPLVTV